MSRRTGSAAGWLLLLSAVARCQTSECDTSVNADPRVTRLVFTRAGRDEGITALVRLGPGQRVPYDVNTDVRLVSERGAVALNPGSGVTSGIYTAPQTGTDQIRLRYRGRLGDEEWGWVAVTVTTEDYGSGTPVCSEPPRGEPPAGGSIVVYRRRITAVHTTADRACTNSVVDVPIYRIPLGERMPLTFDAAFSPQQALRTPDEAVAGFAVTPTGPVIEARSLGRAALEIVGAHGGYPGGCRAIILVEVVPQVCADGGVDGGTSSPDATADASTDAAGDAGRDVGTDAGRDAGNDGGVDAGNDGGVDAGNDAGNDAGSDAPVDAGAAPNSFELGDVLPIGLVAFEGGLYWYDNADHGLHRFDLTTLTDRVVLAETAVLLRDIVAADGRLFWATGPSGPSQVVGWRPGDAAPSAPLLTATRAFDQLTGDGTRLYAHEPDALRWARLDGTGVGAATSTSGQRAFTVAGGHIYYADLGLFGGERGVFRVPTSPDPTTLLLDSRASLIEDVFLEADPALPSSIVVDRGVVYGLGLERVLRARADDAGTSIVITRLPDPGTMWSRMCLARGRFYIVDQFQARLWSVPAEGSATISPVASPGSGVGFSLVCTADSVWWWSGPRLNRYRLP